MLLGLFDGDFSDAFWDKAEEIPEGFIIQREIKKAINGESYFVNNGETGKPVYLQSVEPEAFNYYFKIWENCDSFGLPHGGGWMKERTWLLEFVKSFNHTRRRVENMIEERELRKAQNKNG